MKTSTKIKSPPSGTKLAPARSQVRPLRLPVPRAHLRKILIPVDFSDCSRVALHWALSLAKMYQAGVVLLYVAEIHPAGAEFGVQHLPAMESDLRKIGRRQLAKLKKQEVPPEILCQSVIRAGRADTEILEAAQSLKVDLIVMTAHGSSSQHGQLGSTTERVARFATCPVMLVPVPETCVPFFL